MIYLRSSNNIIAERVLMKIRHISILNYRGIKQLNWTIKDDLVCFIGSGDATKSTILDAIEAVLTPRWNYIFEDTDFFNLDLSEIINITITLGQLPDLFLSEQKYGLFLRGWNVQVGLQDEPGDEDEKVLSISLQVGKDLEPKWLIVNNRLQDEKRISSSDRTKIGVSRLGLYTSKNLSWSPGSVLSAMTGEDIRLSAIVADTIRKIRNEININSFEEIARVVTHAKKLGESLGVASKNDIKANLDLKKMSVKESGISLHDGNVPLRLSGSGTQRLMGLALQTGQQEKGGISLIDEIEYGLEPHRICQTLALLKSMIDVDGQIFMTSHSPCVLQELNVKNLKLVYSNNGITKIQDIIDDDGCTYQKLMRNNPFAFLAKKVLVCEGKTEVGLLRGIDNALWQKNGKRGMWSYGVVSVSGDGDKSFEMAKNFKKLNYQVLLWSDSDVEDKESNKNELKKLGIVITDWDNSFNTESRLFNDLPWEMIKNLVQIVIDEYGEQSVIDQVKQYQSGITAPYTQWQDKQEIRLALGKTAHKKEWYKNIYKGEKVGEIVAKYLETKQTTDLYNKINMIRSWIESDEYSKKPV